MYDFHTHTFLSDGVLSPTELIRRALVRGYRAIAVTDHVGVGNLELVVKTLVKDCAEATKRWDILALPGVEITHVPKEDIDLVARAAKDLGARLVTVHGETIVEPVEPGTNDAAVRSASVDILAHPGLISYDDARLAAERGVYLEMSARKGHSLTNGHVAKVAKQAGAAMVLDSDAHEPDDLLTPELTRSIAMGAGLTDEEAHALLQLNPRNLLAKLGFGPAPASETGAISP
ncbi:MAG: histidinol phosphate phosphatase domain-containing protein [Dehalococcoidia bacterium]|jgi:histidinol phosphatase-like PHP family hydrolase|nr:histidinol phosphate phosphatase domain-containing protein [Dehalococcoidia bacterium]MDP7083492.1 histidinol phosphate phosphatase domain-containing protein [Dehalococcoidia bacterium]MDP7199413.1 histidinol phosphate phosphatase domain-containing protein [Dehalococcoidia bacterium]MDP7509466.1 histidinol phosphate phosphatase domain-containing protein [Dehalococcoidia bacterium]HJN86167.1 histidinol phosphate phosphatase domain-containing protein [Dehalococcoidia bacterium]